MKRFVIFMIVLIFTRVNIVKSNRFEENFLQTASLSSTITTTIVDEKIGYILKENIETYNTGFDDQRLAPSPNSFFITVFNNKNDKATNFTNKFFRPLNLQGEYEICLAEVIFKNTLEIELGNIEIIFQDVRYAERGETIKIRKLTANLGDSANELIKRINNYIEEMHIEFEFKRRLNIRDIHNLNPEQTEFHVPHLHKYKNVFLPLKDNDVFDKIVKNDILKYTPILILCEDRRVIFAPNKSHIGIVFNGNLLNFVTLNKNGNKNEQVMTINIETIPDFESVTLLTDLIDGENYGELQFKPIIKIFTLPKQKNSQTKIFKMEKIDYKRVKKNIFFIIL